MIIIVIMLVGLCVAMLIMLLDMRRRMQSPPTDSQSALLLQANMTEISKSVLEFKDTVSKQLADQLEANNKSQLSQADASIRILRDVTEKLTKLEGTNKNVGDIANELKTLQTVLQNPKQRGVLGEFYLEQILKNIMPPGAFELQYKVAEGLIVDAAIILDDKILPVDSKFSLENYSRLLEAKDGERELLEKLFKTDIKNRIDETSKYILPGKGTLDQALMFIPSEAIYYDLL